MVREIRLFYKTEYKRWLSGDKTNREEVLVEFSELELKTEFETRSMLFNKKISLEDIEDTLFYLSRIEALKIERMSRHNGRASHSNSET